MTRTLKERKLISEHERLTTKGGAGIAARQRIRIKGKLREELDYHTLAYVLHVTAKRRVDERRRLQAADRERRRDRRRGR